MPSKTDNYGLIKPLATENYNVEDQNGNMDLIDKGLVMYGGTTTGAANTYAISSPVITNLKEGMAVSVKFHAASTGASTLNWCGLGAKAIKKADGSNVTNLKISGIYTLRYDGTNFILQGEGASGDATASDLLLGKKATTDVGEITGTMPNVGPYIADTIELNNQNQEYTIQVGYHSGLRNIKAVINGLIASVIKAGTTVGGILGTFTADATATATHILAGKSAYVNGAKVDGSMVDNSAVADQTLATNNAEYTIPAGYHSGLHKVKAVITNLAASVIKAGTTVGGVLGTFTSDATATAAQMLLNVTAYVNGAKITGTIPSKTAQTYNPSTVLQTIAAGQYLSESQTIAATTGTATVDKVLSGYTFNSAAGIGLTGTAVAGKKFASGTVSSGNTWNNVQSLDNSGTKAAVMLQVSGLSFTPSCIILEYASGTYTKYITMYRGDRVWFGYSNGQPQSAANCYTCKVDGTTVYVTGTTFRLPVEIANVTYNWYAFE